MRAIWLVWLILLLISVMSAVAEVTVETTLCYGTNCVPVRPPRCTGQDWCALENVASYLTDICMTVPATLAVVTPWTVQISWLRDGVQGTGKRDLTETEYLDFLRLDGGRIYTMCTDVNVVSDGTKFYKCGTGDFDYYGKHLTDPSLIQSLSSVSIGGHDFRCKNDTIFECGAGNATVKGNNFMPAECCTDGTKDFFNNPSTGVGCWDKQTIARGDSPATGVINVNGRFMGCRLDASELKTDGYTGTALITNHDECSTIYADVFGSGKHAVCGPEGGWVETAEAAGTNTTAKRVKWTVTANPEGCCPADKCWNGASCAAKGTYYTLPDSDLAYLCE